MRFPSDKGKAAYATTQPRWNLRSRRRGSRYRRRQRRHIFRRSTRDPEGRQRQQQGAGSVLERLEAGWSLLGWWSGTEQAMASAAADIGLSACDGTLNEFDTHCQEKADSKHTSPGSPEGFGLCRYVSRAIYNQRDQAL